MTPNKCLYEVKFTLRYKFNEHTPYGISIYKLSPQKANTTTVQCYIEQHYELRFSQVQRHYEEIICYSDSPKIIFDFSKVEWIDANLLAVIGAAIEERKSENRTKRYLKGSSLY